MRLNAYANPAGSVACLVSALLPESDRKEPRLDRSYSRGDGSDDVLHLCPPGWDVCRTALECRMHLLWVMSSFPSPGL